MASPKHSFFRLPFAIGTFVALTLCSLSRPLFAQTEGTKWQRFADDLEVAEVNYPSNPFFSSQLALIRTSLTRYRVGVVRAGEFGRKSAPVNSLCKLSKGVACINANFFDQDGNPLGLVINRGVTYQKIHRGGQTLTGIFEVGRSAMRIVNRSDFTPGSILEAVQAGPRLLAGGKSTVGLRDSGRTRRSGVCLDEQKRLIIYCVISDFIGMSIAELQSVLIQPEVGCVDALNLDGGGSSQLFLSRDVIGAEPGATELFIRGHDEVPVALALFENFDTAPPTPEGEHY